MIYFWTFNKNLRREKNNIFSNIKHDKKRKGGKDIDDKV